MTRDVDTLTKSALNALLAQPLSASKLKKTSKGELVALFDAMPTKDALYADLRNALTDAPTPTTPKARKPRVLADRMMIEPGTPEDVKATKAGSKRHLMAEALVKGATIDELTELLGWNKDTVTSAFRTDMGALGFGVERKGGKYFLLLPKGMKSIPAHDADTTRADALVAACK